MSSIPPDDVAAVNRADNESTPSDDSSDEFVLLDESASGLDLPTTLDENEAVALAASSASGNASVQDDDARESEENDDKAVPNADTAKARERKRQQRKRSRKAAALRERGNTAVYVTGLPDDTTLREVATHFAKCGILLPNPRTGQPCVKLYRNADGSLKGDALVTYALRPSVDNALALLDGAPFRPPEVTLAVEEASFDHKRQRTDRAEPAAAATVEKPSAAPAKRSGVRARDIVSDALSWEDEPRQKGAQHIVVLKNVFDPTSADYPMIRQDIAEGCAAVGDVVKITVFQRNPEGVVTVRFAKTEDAISCIDLMNGRFYDGRVLSAAFYDGKTDYRYKETEDDRQERDREWKKWLEDSAQENKTGTVEGR